MFTNTQIARSYSINAKLPLPLKNQTVIVHDRNAQNQLGEEQVLLLNIYSYQSFITQQLFKFYT